jgi:hypothetical protein
MGSGEKLGGRANLGVDHRVRVSEEVRFRLRLGGLGVRVGLEFRV